MSKETKLEQQVKLIKSLTKQQLEEYFSKKANNQYFTALKFHFITSFSDMFCNKSLSELFGVSTQSILMLKRDYKKKDWYNDFIKIHFLAAVRNKKYPIPVKKGNETIVIWE